MYAFLDQRIPDLNRGGQFLLWSMRSWVQALGGKTCVGHVLAPTFARFGVLAALPPFHAAMSLLNRDGLGMFGFSPVCCTYVNEDEALLLMLVHSLRSEAADQARTTLELLVTEDAVAPLLASLSAVAAHLSEADLVPECPGQASSSASRSSPAGGSR